MKSQKDRADCVVCSLDVRKIKLNPALYKANCPKGNNYL